MADEQQRITVLLVDDEENTQNNTTQNLRQQTEELFRTSENMIPELTSPEETKRLFY